MARTAFISRLIVPLAAALVALPVSAQPAFRVFMASGASILATSRPLVALGKVSFLDEQRRPVTLPASQVDVDATKAAAAATTGAARVWDAKALANLKVEKVQYYGDDPGTPAEPEAAAPTDGLRDGKTPAERLRGEIEALTAKINGLPTSDRQRSMLVIRQLELQQELTRMLSPPAAGRG